MTRLVGQPGVHTSGLPSRPFAAHHTLRVDRADLMRRPWGTNRPLGLPVGLYPFPAMSLINVLIRTVTALSRKCLCRHVAREDFQDTVSRHSESSNSGLAS